MVRLTISSYVVLLTLYLLSPGFAMVYNRIASATPTTIGDALHTRRKLNERQDVNYATTCGYLDGNAQSSRTADPGFNCRIDTTNGLWGFCPTSVISARDCGLAGLCVDNHSCTAGCGRLSNQIDVTTFSCEQTQFCSIVILLNGLDQSYEYIACGREGATETLVMVPTTVKASTTSIFRASSSVSPASSVSAGIPISSSKVSSLTTPTISSPSSTAGLVVSSEPKPTNIGAIVGGAIGGLTVICLTILGALLIRRKHGVQSKDVHPPEYMIDDQPASTKDTLYDNYHSIRLQKGCHWDSSHGPVEMPGSYSVNSEPIELVGDAQSTEDILRSRR